MIFCSREHLGDNNLVINMVRIIYFLSKVIYPFAARASIWHHVIIKDVLIVYLIWSGGHVDSR